MELVIKDQVSQIGFSALQRAENSSKNDGLLIRPKTFGFSALQRAENSSTNLETIWRENLIRFSALQRAENSSTSGYDAIHAPCRVSVLFSEPKIPQPAARCGLGAKRARFSALQRAENSSTKREQREVIPVCGFSALQRAENSSTFPRHSEVSTLRLVSVLFSEPKIPQTKIS